jgi:RNA polymerase sigma factor (sigma-70 family)
MLIQDESHLSQLLARTAQRDQRSFGELYELTSGRLFAVCLRLTTRRDWAEEILQEAFVKIWHRADTYHAGRGTVFTWMTSIVRYTGIDMLRSRRHERNHLGDDALLDMPAPKGADPQFAVLDGPNLDHCLGQLAVDQRESLMLAFYLGLTHEEVGRRLQRPLGTVKSWIRRGLESLKRCLQA